MGMADVPAEHRSLRAHVACTACHASTSLTWQNRTLMVALDSGNGQTASGGTAV
jgi:hypothetical protein